MKVQVTLDTAEALDRKALLAIAQLLGGSSVPVEEERVENAEVEPEPKFVITATEMPMDEPSVDATPSEEPAPKTISADQWTELLLAKRKELGLLGKDGSSVGAPMAAARSEFNSFVKEQSKKYGAESPKNLTPEKLYQFVDEVFSKIVYDPATGFSTGTIPTDAPF